jgi:hypothetical protein
MNNQLQKTGGISAIIAAIFTMIYVTGGGLATPHYVIFASIETVVLLLIMVKAWKWKM